MYYTILLSIHQEYMVPTAEKRRIKTTMQQKTFKIQSVFREKIDKERVLNDNILRNLYIVLGGMIRGPYDCTENYKRSYDKR